MYTIGEVSKLFDLPVSTLRYYDKEGLFPGMRRESGIRKFSEQEIDALRVIECLKKSGLEIRDIKQFMKWCVEGSSTYPERLELFRRQKQSVEEELNRLHRVLAMLRFKCWYYEQAIQDGKGVCYHYTKLLKDVLTRFGIESEVVYGNMTNGQDGEMHVWLKIWDKENSKWIYRDPTRASMCMDSGMFAVDIYEIYAEYYRQEGVV